MMWDSARRGAVEAAFAPSGAPLLRATGTQSAGVRELLVTVHADAHRDLVFALVAEGRR